MLLLGNITSSLPQTTSQIHPNKIIHLLQLGKERHKKAKQCVQGHSANQCQNRIKNPRIPVQCSTWCEALTSTVLLFSLKCPLNTTLLITLLGILLSHKRQTMTIATSNSLYQFRQDIMKIFAAVINTMWKRKNCNTGKTKFLWSLCF